MRAGLGEQEDVAVVVKGLHAHGQTCQCTQVDAWPMLVANAGKKRLENHHVNHSKHEFARRVSVTRGARKRPASFIVGTHCIDKWWQSLLDNT